MASRVAALSIHALCPTAQRRKGFPTYGLKSEWLAFGFTQLTQQQPSTTTAHDEATPSTSESTKAPSDGRKTSRTSSAAAQTPTTADKPSSASAESTPSMASSSSNDVEDDGTTGSSDTPLIVGVIAGFTVGVLLIWLAWYCIRKYRRKRGTAHDMKPEEYGPSVQRSSSAEQGLGVYGGEHCFQRTLHLEVHRSTESSDMERSIPDFARLKDSRSSRK
ncbi:MAG: hypothetical protein Q9174_004483 [Haloplaca sp. 1 TL-2023]